MDVLYPTASHRSLVSKIFFVSIHNHSSRYNPLNSACCCEIALKSLCYSLCCILFYLFNHQSKELVPFSLENLLISNNSKFLFALVGNKGASEFLWIIVDIFWEIEHNCNPHIVRRELNISMLVVCLKDSREKTISKYSINWRGFRCLLIS